MHLFDGPSFRWLVSSALGHQLTRYVSVEPSSRRTVNHAAAALATSVELDLPHDLTLKAEYAGVLIPTDFGLTTHLGLIELSDELTTLFDVTLRLVWTRQERPVRKEDGLLPRKNDYQLVLNLGIDWE